MTRTVSTQNTLAMAPDNRTLAQNAFESFGQEGRRTTDRTGVPHEMTVWATPASGHFEVEGAGAGVLMALAGWHNAASGRGNLAG